MASMASMARTATADLALEVLRLKRERRALLLAHNYQRPEVQDVADFVGDSLGLTQAAAKTDAKIIVFCGVHFMAETAAILCPDKLVLLPDPNAGCSLASMISVESLRRWKAQHPNAVVVAYVNTTAAVKAQSDVCCTSTNAVRVIESIPPDREILFLPDQYLGDFVRRATGRKIHLWPGYCHAHHKITYEAVAALKAEHPRAEFVMHPECGCLTHCMALADKITSTEGIVRHARESPGNEFIVATEVGILHRLRKENPAKTFYPATEEAFCEFMKLCDLENVLRSLEDLEHRVTVPQETAARARRAIERMLELA